MKLYFTGHNYQYAAEQMMLSPARCAISRGPHFFFFLGGNKFRLRQGFGPAPKHLDAPFGAGVSIREVGANQ